MALALSRNGDHAEAVDRARRLYRHDPASVLYISAYADVLIEAGRLDQAKDLLSGALLYYPDSYPLSMLLAQALINEERFGEANAIYKQLSKQRPHDTLVWFQLAETSGLAGNVTEVHLARAEYFYLNGASHRAIQHLEYAKNLVAGGNQQLHAKLTQRIQDLRTEIRASQG